MNQRTLNEREAQQALASAALHFNQGKLDSAANACAEILQAYPTNAAAHHLLGLVDLQRGRIDSALVDLQKAVETDPSVPEYHNSLGGVLASTGQPEKAIALFAKAVSIRSEYVDAHVNLARALREVGRWALAEASVRKALQIDPRDYRAHEVLGLIVQKDRVAEAIRCYRNAMKFGAPQGAMLKRCSTAFSDTGRSRASRRCLEKAVSLQPENAALHSDLLYVMQHDDGCSRQELSVEHRNWSMNHAQALHSQWQPHSNDPTPHRRIHVAYISADLREHSVARFLEPLFKHRNPRNFHLTCYSDVKHSDAVTRRFQRNSDLWRQAGGMSDPRLVDLVRTDRIDILIDPTGHMGQNRMLVFAQKPAPIQVAFPGYPGTTGLAAMDGFLTDAFQNPCGDASESGYSERLIRLPNSSRCYHVDGDAPDVGSLPASTNGRVTFGSFQRPLKITPTVLHVWAGALNAVPGSRLLMLLGAGGDDFASGIRRGFERVGISANRLEFIGRLRRAEYLQLFNRIDIALDTFPYNGCTTTCDGLWMGVPTVSLVGETCVSRVGLSILSQVGLGSLATFSMEAYVEAAAKLAADIPRLEQLRKTLRYTMRQSPLCDGAGVTASFEQALRQMWIEWCAHHKR